MRKIDYANMHRKVKLYLTDGNILIGSPYDVVEEETDEGEDTGRDLLAFQPTFSSWGIALAEEDILKVEIMEE